MPLYGNCVLPRCLFYLYEVHDLEGIPHFLHCYHLGELLPVIPLGLALEDDLCRITYFYSQALDQRPGGTLYLFLEDTKSVRVFFLMLKGKSYVLR